MVMIGKDAKDNVSNEAKSWYFAGRVWSGGRQSPLAEI
jgi:hypothetical protein